MICLGEHVVQYGPQGSLCSLLCCCSRLWWSSSGSPTKKLMSHGRYNASPQQFNILSLIAWIDTSNSYNDVTEEWNIITDFTDMGQLMYTVIGSMTYDEVWENGQVAINLNRIIYKSNMCISDGIDSIMCVVVEMLIFWSGYHVLFTNSVMRYLLYNNDELKNLTTSSASTTISPTLSSTYSMTTKRPYTSSRNMKASRR